LDLGFGVSKLRVLTVLMAAALCSVTVRTQESLAPPRSGLRAVPLPRLDSVEPPVADQLRSAQHEVERAAAGRANGHELAAAYGSLARLFHAYEIFDSAEASYLNAARLAPGESQWPYLLGYLYQQTGQWEDAATQLSTALRLQPGRREAAARLADIALRLNRLRDARDRFTALIAVFPALAQNGLGEIALRESRFNDAIGHFRAALDRVPQANSLHYSLAMAYRGLGRVEQAQAELERPGRGVIKLGDPAVDALAGLLRGERLLVIQGRRALEAGDLRAAADWFDKAVTAAPTSTTARTDLATVLLQLGEHNAAMEQLEAVLRIDPDDERAAVNLAMTLADRSRFADAVTVLNRAHERLPRSVVTATTLARILAAAPDRGVRNASRALELAMRVYQEDPAAVHAETVALALEALSRCGEALEWIRRAVSAAEQSADAAEVRRLNGELGKYTNGCQ
jgi:tetratricopeptide (TPR) repeat protein